MILTVISVQMMGLLKGLLENQFLCYCVLYLHLDLITNHLYYVMFVQELQWQFVLLLLFLRPSGRIAGPAGSLSPRGREESPRLLHIPSLQLPRSCLPHHQEGPDLRPHQAALLR